ncbi:MAG: hypothetical protein HYU69_02810 [Bacteroidetes bacterium]|nr:hypothetical protein [Bacteroidota bacterium]
MKKYVAFCFISVFVGTCFAQKIKITESVERIGEPGAKNNVLAVIISEATPEEIESDWKALTKSYKAKVSTMEDVIFSDNAVIKSISNNTIDMYARSEKIKEGETRFIIGFNLGGAYLSSILHPEQFREIKQIVNDFAVKTTRDAIANKLKAAQKVLDKLSDEQKNLVKKNETLNKDVETNKQKIEELKEKIKREEEELVINKTDHENKTKEVDAQRKVVESLQARQLAVQ